jgi:hypothetical protein
MFPVRYGPYISELIRRMFVFNGLNEGESEGEGMHHLSALWEMYKQISFMKAGDGE